MTCSQWIILLVYQQVENAGLGSWYKIAFFTHEYLNKYLWALVVKSIGPGQVLSNGGLFDLSDGWLDELAYCVSKTGGRLWSTGWPYYRDEYHGILADATKFMNWTFSSSIPKNISFLCRSLKCLGYSLHDILSICCYFLKHPCSHYIHITASSIICHIIFPWVFFLTSIVKESHKYCHHLIQNCLRLQFYFRSPIILCIPIQNQLNSTLVRLLLAVIINPFISHINILNSSNLCICFHSLCHTRQPLFSSCFVKNVPM